MNTLAREVAPLCLTLAGLIACTPHVAAGQEADAAAEEAQDLNQDVYAPVATIQAVRQDNEAVDEAQQDNEPKEEEEIPPELAAMVQQLRPQYESVLHGRLHGIRGLCNPSVKEQRLLLAAGEEALDEALLAFVKAQQNQGGGGLRVGNFAFGGFQAQTPTDPKQALETALEFAIVETLPEEMRELLAREKEKRVEDRRRSTACILVAAVDKQLSLSAEQRDRLEAALLDNWDKRWVAGAPMLIHGVQFMPKIPAKVINPVLDDDQRKIWKKVPQHNRVHMNMNWNFFQNFGLQIEPFEPLAPEAN